MKLRGSPSVLLDTQHLKCLNKSPIRLVVMFGVSVVFYMLSFPGLFLLTIET
jgi:hypothetical protein